MHRIVRAVMLLLGCLAIHSYVFAGPGELDPGYGSGGIARVPAYLTNSTKILATARQPDGKILLAGEARASEAWSPFLAVTKRKAVVGRLNADGSLDRSFGTDGWVVVESMEFPAGASAAAISPAAGGKILVGIQVDYDDARVVRLTAAGSFDRDFGFSNQILRVPNSSSLQLAGIAEQTDGRIVLAASPPDDGYPPDFSRIFRLNAREGSPDYGFGQAGVVDISFRDQRAWGAIRALHLRADGSILVGGWVIPPSAPYDLHYRDFFLAKLTQTGALDSQFGSGGKVAIDFAGWGDEVRAIAEDTQGRLIAAGKSADSFHGDNTSIFGVVRLDPGSGAIDTAFGTQGKAQLDTVGTFFTGSVTSLQVASNGDLLLAGYATRNDPSAPNSISILARLDSSGQRVASFGVNGVVASTQPVEAYNASGDAFAGAFSDGNTILAVGTRRQMANVSPGSPPLRSFALGQRFSDSDGTPQGNASTGQAINAAARAGLNAASLPDGRTLIVGSMGDAARVTRLLANGELDVDFGHQGSFDFQIANAPTSGRAIAVDANGNMLVASVVTNPPGQGSRWSITRWTPDGALDYGFGNGDTAVSSFDDSDIIGVAVQANGKVVVAGMLTGQFAVARFNADGSPDASFNGSGVAKISAGLPEQATALTIQPDGRILIAGSWYDPRGADTQIARLTENGAMDSTWGFGGNGIVYVGGAAAGDALTVQSDGMLVMGATCFSYLTSFQPSACVVRLASNGDIDYSFGQGGFAQSSAGLGAAYVTGIGLQRDGKILIGGDLAGGYPFIMRLKRDGSLDTTYNGVGFAEAAVESGQWIAHFIDANGKARFLGYSTPASGAEDILVVQFQPQTIYSDPDPFQFPNALNVPVNRLVTSAPATIGGINVPVPISVVDGEYSIGCTDIFTSAAGTISNGQSVCVRHVSANAGMYQTLTRLMVGSVEAWFFSVTGALPETSITEGPATLVAATTTTFTFASSDPAATFRCSLDAASFTSCTSPASYTSLAEGDHRFRVVAVNAIGEDATPAEKLWRIDVTPPETVIDSGPSGNGNQDDDKPGNRNEDTATFIFSSSEAGSTFECRTDGGSFVACASPITLTSIPEGWHTFEVRARDLAGNVDATPAIRTWHSH